MNFYILKLIERIIIDLSEKNNVIMTIQNFQSITSGRPVVSVEIDLTIPNL